MFGCRHGVFEREGDGKEKTPPCINSSVDLFAVTAGLDVDHHFVKGGEVLFSASSLRASSGGLALTPLPEGHHLQPAAWSRRKIYRCMVQSLRTYMSPAYKMPIL